MVVVSGFVDVSPATGRVSAGRLDFSHEELHSLGWELEYAHNMRRRLDFTCKKDHTMALEKYILDLRAAIEPQRA